MSQSGSTKPKALLHAQDVIQCKNGCGYYGNPEWAGYCSMCHREINQKVKPDRILKSSIKKVERSYSDVQDRSLGFSKFAEKKKQQTEKKTKTIKNIIKRGHTSKDSTSQSPSRDLCIGEVLLSSSELSLKAVILKDVIDQIQKQIEIMNKCYDKSIDEQSEAMQDFYNFMFNRCETHPAYQDLTSEDVDLLMDKIEEQLMTSLRHTVHNVAALISSEYEEKDLALQERIRSLHWITSQHLGLNITEGSPDVRDLIDKAIADVIQMDSKIAPQQKIKCIVNCSESIFNIIKLCQGVTASADEFLPAMVYIVLKANPPLLQSNIKYITCCSIPTRLRSGEGAYYFTNLCCAVAFIEELTAESLNMTEDEFTRYISGEMPLAHPDLNSTSSEGLRLMTQNLVTLNEMQEKNQKTLDEMLNLRDDMLKFQDTLQKCKPATPLIISPTPYAVPANTDMSLIPEILRNRIVLLPTEDILVEIDHDPSEQRSQEEQPNLNSITQVPSTFVSDVCNLSPDIIPSFTKDNSTNFPTLTPLQVLLPTQTPHKIPVESFSQAVINIQDLEYPTELLPQTKSDTGFVEFGPYEGCDSTETEVNDPMSPETSFIEESLHLPPPLLPVVVPSVNNDTEKK